MSSYSNYFLKCTLRTTGTMEQYGCHAGCHPDTASFYDCNTFVNKDQALNSYDPHTLVI